MFSKRTIEELQELVPDNNEQSQQLEVTSPGGNTFTVQLTQGRASQLARSQQQNEQQQPQQQGQGQQSQRAQAQEWRIRKITTQQGQQQY